MGPAVKRNRNNPCNDCRILQWFGNILNIHFVFLDQRQQEGQRAFERIKPIGENVHGVLLGQISYNLKGQTKLENRFKNAFVSGGSIQPMTV